MKRFSPVAVHLQGQLPMLVADRADPLDSPEFDGLLNSLLDDLASGELREQPEFSSSSESLSENGSLTCETHSIGNSQKVYILTRLLSTPDAMIKKDIKKRLAKVSRATKPRVMSTDIRASYSQMMANVYNSDDYSRMLGMYTQYCTPDVLFRFKKKHPHTNEIIETKLIGPNLVANLTFSNINMFPDCVTHLRSHKYESDSGIVSCTFIFTMTKLFNVASIHDVFPDMIVGSQSNRISPAPSTENDSQRLSQQVAGVDVVETLQSVQEALPVRKRPIHVILKTKLVMRTDENKRIVEMLAITSNIQNDFSVEEE